MKQYEYTAPMAKIPKVSHNNGIRFTKKKLETNPTQEAEKKTSGSMAAVLQSAIELSKEKPNDSSSSLQDPLLLVAALGLAGHWRRNLR